MEEDRVLIAQFLRGDQRAFDRLVLKHQERVRQFIFRATGDVDDANDLAQEVFIKAYRNLHRFRGESELATWLYRIAANALNSHFRRRRVREWLPLGELADDEDGDRADERSGRLRRLLARLPRLSKQERQVVIMRGLQGLSVAETAAVLATSKNVVKVAFHTAKKKLRESLTDE